MQLLLPHLRSPAHSASESQSPSPSWHGCFVVQHPLSSPLHPFDDRQRFKWVLQKYISEKAWNTTPESQQQSSVVSNVRPAQLLSPHFRRPLHWLSKSQSPSPLSHMLIQEQQKSPPLHLCESVSLEMVKTSTTAKRRSMLGTTGGCGQVRAKN